MLRKVAVAAASKPHVEIRQDGDQFYIKTSTTVRTTEINFKVGEGFEEETVDGRKCRVRPPVFAPWPGSPSQPLAGCSCGNPGLPFQPMARFRCRVCSELFAERVCATRLLWPREKVLPPFPPKPIS
jgi:hypothetical protein